MATTGTPTKRPAAKRATTKRPAAKPTARASSKRIDAAKLLKMNQRQLDELFSSSPAGATPEGVADGTVIAFSGTPAAKVLAPLLGLAWRGKVFYPHKHDLLNRILPISLRAVRAKVYRDTSLFDGKEAIILDYGKTSLLAHSVRDEIREVAPGLYLGIVYIRRMKTINFALSFSK
ncbi:MAG: hypothetical protein QOJ85_4178 [Solirubrobacteraceae bacterium]|nr:hypothetical protein [Solirubrobacteraceae bacterium]MEA2241093.1 hypothetical protein [Solirubrobacteraceae bacterium]